MRDGFEARRLSRRGWMAFVSMMAAAQVALPLRAQTRPPGTRVTLAVGAGGALCSLPVALAHQLGFFRAEGLDVELVEHAGGASALQAVLAGQADVASAPFESLIRQQLRGQMLRAFVMQGRAPQIALGVSSRAVPRFNSLAQLRGRRIGVMSTGSTTRMVAGLALARAGVSATDVSWLPLPTAAAAIDALRSGQVDALSYPDPAITVLEQRGEVRIAWDTRSLRGTRELFGGEMPAACLCASESFVRRSADVVQPLANAVVHALKWLRTAGPSDIVRAVPESQMLGDRAVYLAAFEKVREAYSPDGLMDSHGGETALRAIQRLEPDFDGGLVALERTYTNLYAERARQRLKA